MENKIIERFKLIFYENYYGNFLLSNLPNVKQLYIPLSGSELDSAPTAKPSDRILIEDVQSRIICNLSAPNHATMNKSYVILGDGGTGKSTLALSIVHEFWNIFCTEATQQVVIPLYIQLSQLGRLRHNSIKATKSILEAFVLLHFSYFEQLKVGLVIADVLKVFAGNFQLLLVLDEYENFDDRHTLWEQLEYNQYNLKVVTFCRPEVMTVPEFERKFSYKFENTTHKAKFYFLLPFASVQISSYLLKVVEFLRNLEFVPSNTGLFESNEPWLLTKEVTKQNLAWERDSAEYRHWLDIILPELGQISQTPFLLTLLVQVLPTIVEEYRQNPNQSSFDMELIQLISTEVGIYDQFTEKWFDYSTKRIMQTHPELEDVKDFLPHLLETYSKNLAIRLFCQNKGLVGDGKFSRKLTEEWDLWKQIENNNEVQNDLTSFDTISHLFPQSKDEVTHNQEKLNHLLALRTGCLLRCFQFQAQGENYMFQFLHSSLLEYFVSRTIFKGMRAEINFHLRKFGVQSTHFPFSLESIRGSKYIGIFHMLVERTRTDPSFKNLLLSVVYSSREIISIGVMSSNAFTILTQAFNVWCNEDFSHVYIADADISHCVFINCKFVGADMSRALLTGTHFYKCQLQAANLYDCHMSRGLNLHLQEGSIDQKGVYQVQIFKKECEEKAYIVYNRGIGMGDCDLSVLNVNKRTSKIIIGPPEWSVLNFIKLQNAFLIALQPHKNFTAEQTLVIFEMKKRSKLKFLDQDYLRAEQEKHPQEVKCLRQMEDTHFVSFTDERQSLCQQLEVFTVPIPNHNDNVVCYRTLNEEINHFIASSHYFPLSTSLHPFNVLIYSSDDISKSEFCVNHSTMGSIYFAYSSADCLTLVELHKEKVLFQKPFLPPQIEGQVVLTFIRFSPDGKYLLFDMCQTLYILSLRDCSAGVLHSACKEVSLSGSKGGYDTMCDCDFAALNSTEPLVALVYDHGIPLILNLATGQKLQSINLPYECSTLFFLSDADGLQISCVSHYGSISSHKIYSSPNHRAYSSYVGNPRSIQALNPQTDFHSLIDSDMDHIDIFVSFKGKYMAVVKENKYKFTAMGDEDVQKCDSVFCLLLFKIDANSGKRRFVFRHTFSSLVRSDIHVFFINETFICLTYPHELIIYKCEVNQSITGEAVNSVRVPINGGPETSTIQKSWSHESANQIIFQHSSGLEVYSVCVSPDNSSILFEKSRFCFDLKQACGSCLAATVFFHVNESENFAFVIPSQELRSCFIWNLNTGDVAALQIIGLELPSPSSRPYIGEDVKHVTTVQVVDQLPGIVFIDIAGAAFRGVINQVDKLLEVDKIRQRYVYRLIEASNYFAALRDRNSFIFGTNAPWKSCIAISTTHDVKGFHVRRLTHLENRTIVHLLVWDNRSISCYEVDLSAMENWVGDVDTFLGWRLLWCDPPNNQFSLLFSNTTNTVLGKGEDWNLLSKRYACKGKVLRYLHWYISLPSLFEQVHDNSRSIFSKDRDLLLSGDSWILLVITRKKHFPLSRRVKLNFLHNHTGIIIEGIRHEKHFALRADLVRNNADNSYEIMAVSLKQKKEKYAKLYKQFVAKEFKIPDNVGMLIIEKILADKQSEINYHLLNENCNTWVKSVLALAGVDVEREYRFVDLPNDFFTKQESKNVLTFPGFAVSGMTC